MLNEIVLCEIVYVCVKECVSVCMRKYDCVCVCENVCVRVCVYESKSANDIFNNPVFALNSSIIFLEKQ